MIIPALIGAAAAYLYFKHSKHGVDKCSDCGMLEQVGENLKYTCTPGGVPVPHCRKCKPELFPAPSFVSKLLKKAEAL